MNRKFATYLLSLGTLSLGISLEMRLWGQEAIAQQVIHPTQPQQLQNATDVLQELARMQVVYLGEQHNSPADHRAQYEIVQALHRANPRMAIGLEMFQRPFQRYLDQYVAGEINEEALQQFTQYDQRWGFPWESYAPILRFARRHRLPLLALNAPSEVTRRVARQGLAGLTPEDAHWVPPASELKTDNEAYRQMMQSFFDNIHRGQGHSLNFENFFLAQILWDETMADGIADYLKANPGDRIVVLVGQGHLVYGYGIPNRVRRRMAGVSEFEQRSVLLNPPPEIPHKDATGTPAADFFWSNPIQ